jgi:hypothetical protein
MNANHKPSDIERMKEKAYNLFYRMHVCRLITNQAMEMHGLFCNKERFDKPIVTEIEGCQKLLNKVWMLLKEREILLFQEMIDLDFNSLEIHSVMTYAEPRYTDDYAIMKMYGIDLRDSEGNKRRIDSLRWWC